MCLLVVVAGIAIIARLFSLQVMGGTLYLPSRSAVKEIRTLTELAPRGRITDRNGAPIAVNSQAFSLHIVNSGLGNAELNAVLLEMCAILEKNNDTWLNSLGRYLAFGGDGGGGGVGGINGDSGGAGSGGGGGAGALRFGRTDFAETEAWQRSMLGIKSESGIARTPAQLFALLKSDKIYGIDAGYSDAEAYRIMQMRYLITASKGAFELGKSVCVAKNINQMTIAEIEENAHRLAGATIGAEPVREYRNSQYIAHVLGYVGAITEAQHAELGDDGYTLSDSIGQYGVESQNEAYLRGSNGEKRIEVLASGNTASEINGRPAIPGSDVVLTIDMDLQTVAMKSLERNIGLIRSGEPNDYMKTDSDVNFHDADAGAAVAVDVRTGEVLTMASYPSFDASIFLRGADSPEAQQAISELWEDPLHSSWNRAIQGTYSPGSTFKPVTGIAALEEGVITRNTQIYDSGRINIGGRNLICLEGGHGYLDVRKALEASCNVFFYDVGTKTTIDNLEKWAKLFGLGVKTGIDLPYEREGTMSGKEYKREMFNDIWRPADTAQVSIGQLYNSFTPLQMACYMSALANGGKYYKPYVTKKIIRYDGSTVRETVPEMRQIPVNPDYIDAIKDGMVASTTEIDGTASDAFASFPYSVAGKTGTAETGFEDRSQSSNSLFVCYAPADDPQIAVAVVIEKGVWGSYTAPVARDILEAYFGLTNQVEEDDSLPGATAGLVP
jgi:penicillin-binding protein 2